MGTLQKAITNIDLKSVLDKVQTSTGMSPAQLKKAEELYKQYLTLRAMHPEMVIVPPKLADEVWHEHILSTKQYFHDCQEIFGTYLHHHTDDEDSVLKEGWENSKKLFKQEFGTNLTIEGLGAARCR